MLCLERWKTWAKSVKLEAHALFLAYRDPRTPWYAKALAICVVAYALSPIDLIPDPIPILGYLDDLMLLPLGILLVRRLIPPDVMADCRRQAADRQPGRPKTWPAAVIIVLIWAAVLAAAMYLGALSLSHL
jgi:uncharacterized membrane protein YkvA (DUF1232 family)